MTSKDFSKQIERLKLKLMNDGDSSSVISEEEVQEFEEKYNIKLPEGYRRFILEIANGNVRGYMSGIIPLGYIFNLPGDKSTQENYFSNIRKVFPFEYPWIHYHETEIDEKYHLLKYTYPRCMEHLTTHGNMIIENDGCAEYWNLIITGPQRGKVWSFHGNTIIPSSLDFLDWIETIHNKEEPYGNLEENLEKLRPRLEENRKEFYI